MAVIGSQNAHNLVTISSDGKLCSWSIDNLAQPIDVIDLNWKQKSVCLYFFAGVLKQLSDCFQVTSFVMLSSNLKILKSCSFSTSQYIFINETL